MLKTNSQEAHRGIVRVAIGTAALALAGIPVAQAQTTITGLIEATIELVDSCIVNDDQDPDGTVWGTLDFGTHPTLFFEADAEVLANGSGISVLCAPGIQPTFTLVEGQNDAESGDANHAMALNTNYVPYTIYTDTGRTTALPPSGTIGLDEFDDPPVAQTINLYGRAFGADGLTEGTYTDTLTVTLSFD